MRKDYVRKRLVRFTDAWWGKFTRTEAGPLATPCRVWNGFVCKYGYARTEWRGKPGVLLHRASYEVAYGPFDPLLKVCHKCDRPACLEPTHLFLGTQKDNLRDMFAKGRARPRGLVPKNRAQAMRDGFAGVVTGSKELQEECLSRWHSTSYPHPRDDSAMVSVLGIPGASDSHLIPPDKRPKWWTVELPQNPEPVSDTPDSGAELSSVSSSLRRSESGQ